MSTKPIVLLDLRPLQTNYKNKGIGRYTRELATAIHKKYSVWGLKTKSLELPDMEIPILIEAPRWKRQWVWDMFILPLHLWFKRVTLFHNFVALGPLDTISYPVLFAHRCLITVHDLHMFHENASPINQFYRSTKRIRIQKKSLGNVYQIITDAHSTAKELQAFEKLSKGKITVAPLGCEHVDKWQSGPPSTEQIAGILKSKYILSVGDTENKNLYLAFLILKALRQSQPKVQWIICGNPAAIKEQLKVASLPQWIIPTRPSDNDLYHLYKMAQMTLITSTEEGFGIPVLEAMKIGSPALAGNLEVFSEHLPAPSHLDPLDSSPSSIKVWSQACEKVLNDQIHRNLMIENGLSHSQKFTWALAAEKIMEYYPKK